MKGFGWENQVPYEYLDYYPDPDKVRRILLIGDHVWVPNIIKYYKEVIMWTDTPLVDCNFPVYDNMIYVPASRFVRAILENCEVKNVTDVVHRPLLTPQINVPKKYDMIAILTQDQRKGHESLSRVLRKLDGMISHKLKLKLRVHENIRLFFNGYRNIEIIDIPRINDYVKYLHEIADTRINLFPSYVEGVGYPPIEATQLGQQLIMGDIDATREFVNVKSARVIDARLVKHYYSDHYFLYQYYDEDEYLELLLKALEDPKCCVPELKATDMKDYEKLFKKVM